MHENTSYWMASAETPDHAALDADAQIGRAHV